MSAGAISSSSSKMRVEEQVLDIRRQLEKMTGDGADQSQALDLLKALSSLNINLNILTTTRIGMTVNALRKACSDEDVVATAKMLIKNWKKLVPENEGNKCVREKGNSMPGINVTATPTSGTQPTPATAAAAAAKTENGSKEKETAISAKTAAPAPAPSSCTTTLKPTKASATTDEVRISCRKLLAAALRGDGEMPEESCKDPDDLADMIEEVIFQSHRALTTPKYKNQVRSRVFNLRDKKNKELRFNVLCGTIPPERIAIMTAEEMASDEVKRMRQAYIKAGIDAAQLARVEGTKSTMIKCGKCGKHNCTYNQIQTRSADEPMTTFVLCNECGNRWKFC